MPESRRRGRGVRIRVPVGPGYIYYDYPYYYSRGYYPTHIGGYVYYPFYQPTFRAAMISPRSGGTKLVPRHLECVRRSPLRGRRRGGIDDGEVASKFRSLQMSLMLLGWVLIVSSIAI